MDSASPIWGALSSVLPLGALSNGAASEVRNVLGDVHFVGTETSDVWKGYMEGAVRSGTRGGCECFGRVVSGSLREVGK